MAIKPTKYPTWAENDELDPITLAANKVEPTEEWKGSGQKRRQPIPRPYMNYQFDLLSRWIEWIDEQVSGALSPTLEAAWPIGSVYYSTSTANPAIAFGFGTWTAIGQGRFVVGYNAGDSDFNAVKKTGGAKTHNHGGVTGAAGSHTHTVPREGWGEDPLNGPISGPAKASIGGRLVVGSGLPEVDETIESLTHAAIDIITSGASSATHTHTISSASSLPSYIVLVMWERTA
jgi:hypothetical protein